MIILAISVLVSLIIDLVLVYAVEMNVIWACLVGMLGFALTFVLLSRFVMQKVSAIMEAAQKDLQAGRFDKAIKSLEGAYRYAPWQFYVKGQVNSQIGTILYLKRDFAEAFPYLEQGFVKHWMAMGMLAICYMKRSKPAKMKETFEKAVTGSKKEHFLYALYAYCLDKIGEREAAIGVLERGIKKAGADERLSENIEELKSGRKMRMMDFGDVWYQFHLENPGALIKKQTKAVQGRRKIVRR